MFGEQIGALVMGVLSVIFGSYGLRGLLIAYRTDPLHEWIEKAGFAVAGVLLAALFACVSLRTIG